MVFKEVKIFANPTGCAHETGPTRPCRSQTAYHGHVRGPGRAGDASYALQLTIFPLPHRFYADVDVDFYSLETILRSVTGFKGEEGQNPSESHTKKSARVVRIAERQQRTCPSVHVPSEAASSSPLTVSHMLPSNPNEVGKFLCERFCRASLDIHGSRQALHGHRALRATTTPWWCR